MAYKVYHNDNMMVAISAIDQSWGEGHTKELKEKEKIYFNYHSGRYVGFKDAFHLYLTTEDDGYIHWENHNPQYPQFKLDDVSELLTMMYMVDDNTPETYQRGKYSIVVNLNNNCEMIAGNDSMKFNYDDMKNLMNVIEEVLLMSEVHHQSYQRV